MDKLLLISAFAIFVGVIILGFVAINAKKGANRKTWPSVPGKITASEINVITIHGEDSSTSYHPKISYGYVVHGVFYTSSNLQASQSILTNLSEKSANAIITQYPLDREVTVYYDPEKPQYAFLDPSTSSLSLIILAVIGSGVFLCGILFLFLRWLVNNG